MPKFKVRLARDETNTMGADFVVEAKNELGARRKALALGRNEENDFEWGECGGGGHTTAPYVAYVKQV